ncbi:MAG: DUF2785 domain-containing protein [Defluviitaleaceae bacterium]|nr:DUF2785 domain-containing protein [Defluviitaleaceae bacterium]
MRTFDELKNTLAQMKGNDFKVANGIDLDGLVDDMLRFVGDTDPELRDDLICSAFYTWADEDNGTLTTSHMHKILNTCISDDYLFLGIGENGTDSVFKRAFSSLYIGLALCRHDEEPYLSKEEVQGVKQTLLRYIKEERDFRGYVEGKGWAHSIAHVSDALNDLVFCDCLSREDVLEVLDAVKNMALNSTLVYEAGEDDRMAVVFESICEEELLSKEDIKNWLSAFDYRFDGKSGSYPQVFYSHVNRRHFLRCIYFQLLAIEGFEEIAEYVKGILGRIERE